MYMYLLEISCCHDFGCSRHFGETVIESYIYQQDTLEPSFEEPGSEGHTGIRF